MSKKYVLSIVMHRATQFDGPLFAKLSQNVQLDLKIYYTALGTKAETDIDPELGFRPDWGHMATTGYEYTARSPGISGLINFLRQIINDNPNLIIISGYTPFLHIVVTLYAWGHRVPVGLRSDTTLEHTRTPRNSLKGIFKSWILRGLFKVYSTAHPVGTLAKENLLHYSISDKQIFIFPYAVNNKWFFEESQVYHMRRSELRRQLSINENAFVVLGVLKFHEREDPITLIKGFKEFTLNWNNSSHLLLIGDGPLRGEIETTVCNDCIPNVTLQGYVAYQELPKYYAVADVFVHPGVGESWGVSVNESMACGLPVILSDRVGSQIDLVEGFQTGFIFETKNSTSLAHYLTKMASDGELSKVMGRNAQILIEKWGYENTENSLLRALEFLASVSP